MRQYRLMAPGPVPLSPAVRESLAEPMIHHRTPEFSEILQTVWKDLRTLLGTQQPVLMQTATGSGGMESAIVNTLSPGDQVLVVDSGKFGERWLKMCLAFGMQVQRLAVDWGEAVKVEQVVQALQQNPRIRAVLCQACETSTGVLHPIRDLAAAIRDREDCLFIVDAITVLGAAPLQMDDWGLDVVVGGAQKGLMLPPGLALLALSAKAWRFNAQARTPRFYFDLLAERKANEKGETRFSSAVSHIRAMPLALAPILRPGLSERFAFVQRLADATRAAGRVYGLSQFPTSPSPTLTVWRVPEGVDGGKWRRHLEEKYRITVMGGQDHLKGKILRIGHLGYVLPEDILATVEAVGESLADLGQEEINRAVIDEALNVARKVLES